MTEWEAVAVMSSVIAVMIRLTFMARAWRRKKRINKVEKIVTEILGRNGRHRA